jgi:hypothetical protein
MHDGRDQHGHDPYEKGPYCKYNVQVMIFKDLQRKFAKLAQRLDQNIELNHDLLNNKMSVIISIKK